MGMVKKTIVETVVLGLVGLLVASTANAVRASKNSIVWRKNYFDKGIPLAAIPQQDEEHKEGDGSTGAITPEPKTDEHPDHPYQEVSFEEVAEIFNDPSTEMGANVFIDARNDELYAEGHIPGAIQADHYRLEEYIEIVLDYVESAEKVIVYCNGGDCEDSIFLCKDLLDFDVPYDKIYLYAGGWKEWSKRGMPAALGNEEAVDE
jgi:rhodanese-related sulfurtransferase